MEELYCTVAYLDKYRGKEVWSIEVYILDRVVAHNKIAFMSDDPARVKLRRYYIIHVGDFDSCAKVTTQTGFYIDRKKGERRC